MMPGRHGPGWGHSILTVLAAEYTDGCPHWRDGLGWDHSWLPVLVAEYTEACLHLFQRVWESSRAGGRALAVGAKTGADRDLWSGMPSSGSMSLSFLMMYGDRSFQAVGAMVKQNSLEALAEARMMMSVQLLRWYPARLAVSTSAPNMSPARTSLYTLTSLQAVADLDTNMMKIILATQFISISANTPVVDSKKKPIFRKDVLMIVSPRPCLHNKSL